MNATVWGLVGLVVGVGVAVAVCRLLYAARSAAVVAERDLLRERVLDLETSLAEDMETAALLAPLKDALVRVETHVGSLERDRMEQFGSLRALLSRVEGETQHLGRQTASLAGSLRSSTVRGAWGEVQLRRVLEASGMLSRCDFDEQVTAVSAHDRGVRPDVVVRLPGGKVLVIDAKAPMNAFLDAQAEDLADDERAALLVDHATGLGRHVAALAAKEYWSAFREGPEMVVCFVPSDAMLGAALAAPAVAARAGPGPAGRAGRPGCADGPAAHGGLHLAAGRPVGQRPRAARPRPRPAPPPRHPRRPHGQGGPQPAVQRRGLQRHGRARWSRGSW